MAFSSSMTNGAESAGAYARTVARTSDTTIHGRTAGRMGVAMDDRGVRTNFFFWRSSGRRAFLVTDRTDFSPPVRLLGEVDLGCFARPRIRDVEIVPRLRAGHLRRHDGRKAPDEWIVL